MKKGRRYVEPMTGRGDKDIKKRDVKKIKREAGKTWDGVSRPSTAVSYTHLTLPTIYSV